nr:MAG TPA: hypothetical protein [Caudoviricetes sp.]DAY61868.1 MAG TPA: hypothetical protein [Caudoviricetes sp.]
MISTALLRAVFLFPYALPHHQSASAPRCALLPFTHMTPHN